jgi:hypothetical protein
LEIPFERYTSAGVLAGELAHGRLATPERFEGTCKSVDVELSEFRLGNKWRFMEVMQLLK